MICIRSCKKLRQVSAFLFLILTLEVDELTPISEVTYNKKKPKPTYTTIYGFLECTY